MFVFVFFDENKHVLSSFMLLPSHVRAPLEQRILKT
jgi:hypothetical protein